MAGVLVPLVVVSAWVGAVWSLARRFALSRRLAWPLAVAALVLPVVLFAITKTV